MFAAPDLPLLLFVCHDLGGGTNKHVHELAGLLSNSANVLLLQPGELRSQIKISSLTHEIVPPLYFRMDKEYSSLLALLNNLGVRRVHYHHTLGIAPSILGMYGDLKVPHDFTIHDYYFACPQVHMVTKDGRYCGEKGEFQCHECLRERPAPGNVNIRAWRAKYSRLVQSAERVFAPSNDAALRFQRYYPDCNVVIANHPDLSNADHKEIKVFPLNAEEPLRVVVLGTMTRSKGLEVLEGCAENAKTNGLPLIFHLLGEPYRTASKRSMGQLRVHGKYREEDLSILLNNLQPHLVWFPAQCPETYSYTLSACFLHGLPVVGPNLGAFTERLSGRAWSWVIPWDLSAGQINEFFVTVRLNHFLSQSPPRQSTARKPPFGAPFCYERDYLKSDQANTVPMLWQCHEQLSIMINEHKSPARGFVQLLERYFRRIGKTLFLKAKRSDVLRRSMEFVPLRWRTRLANQLRGN